MLDIFTIGIPLFALALWVATETKRSKHTDLDSDIDNEKAGKHVQYPYKLINLTYLSPILSPDPVTRGETNLFFPLQLSSLFSRWVGTQDYILIFLAPLNLVTCATFLALYTIRAADRAYIPFTVQILLFGLYSALVCAAVYALRKSNRHAESSFVVAVMGTLRALEYLAPLLLPQGSYELLIARSVLDTWGNFLAVYILSVLPREFLNEDKCKEAYIEETFSPSGNAAEEPPVGGFTITRDNIITSVHLVFSLITSMLLVIPDWHHKPWVMIGFECSISATLIVGAIAAIMAVSILMIFKVKKSSHDAYVSGISARWLIVVVIIGGVLLRILYDAGSTAVVIYNGSYVPLVNSRAFVNWWKETFTIIIPLAFLISYIINKAIKDKIEKIRSAFTVSKRIFCAYLLNLHLMAVGILLETTSYPFTFTCACIMALLFTTNISLILFKFVPPLSLLRVGPTTIKGKSDE